MQPSTRTLALAATLALALVPLARAGGYSARVEGPEKDGTYLVRTATCQHPASMSVTAHAEGVVNGERRSLPLKLTATKEVGVYQFKRTWPSEGRWLVRLQLSGGRKPVTVATVAADGTVGENEFLWDGDVRQACDEKLAVNSKHP